MNLKKIIWLDVIDFFGLFIIGLYIFLSSIFVSGFAVIHWTLPNGLPVFVGEICLFICLGLWAAKLTITKVWRPWYWLWVFYVVWILWASWCGIQNGAFLAFRHAALFYYLLFALLGYSFFNRRLLNNPFIFWSLLIGLVVLIAGKWLAYYYFYTYFVLALILILRVPSKIARCVLSGGLALLYLQYFFGGSRSHFLGSLAAITFISVVSFFLLLNWKFWFRLIVFAGFLFLVGIGIKHFSDPNAIKSLTMPAELIELYHGYQHTIDLQKAQFTLRALSIKLYDDDPEDRRDRSQSFGFVKDKKSDRPREVVSSSPLAGKPPHSGKEGLVKHSILSHLGEARYGSSKFYTSDFEESLEKIKPLLTKLGQPADQFRDIKSAVDWLNTTIEPFRIYVNHIKTNGVDESVRQLIPKGFEAMNKDQLISLANSDLGQELKRAILNQLYPLETPKSFRYTPRTFGNVYGNILFRWFIWEDMWDDLIAARSLWGVGLGKPQRSKSLEILDWATMEWSRDGWITPHNSFYHMVYRAGIIGVLIVGGIFLTFVRLCKIFIAKRSFTGILLLSILIYWMVMANFLVILELPYNAVLFWMILGMTYAYAKGENNES